MYAIYPKALVLKIELKKAMAEAWEFLQRHFNKEDKDINVGAV
jgi:hypothetical protein